MLKTIPKSSISKRPFSVYKKWSVSNSQYEILSASVESGNFNTGSANTQNGIYTHLLYKSIKSKYYNQEANPFTIFGSIENFANLSSERRIGDTIYVLSLPQEKYGEGIKKQSVELSDLDNGINYADDGYGNIISDKPLYNLVLLDVETNEITISDNEEDIFEGTITSLDLETGITVLTFGSDTDTLTVIRIDLENGIVTFPTPLDFDGLQIDVQKYGNVFYTDGLIVLSNNVSQFSNYDLDYRSTKTIYENEVLITARAGEFNYSQNPTAVDVVLSGSYDFNTTSVYNSFPSGRRKIKEVLDIKRKESYVGSYNTSVSGSWDDYYDSASIDPTGSYLTTYITTIGLYDKDGDMVAIAKLPKPIKNLPDYDMNFIVRFDT